MQDKGYIYLASPYTHTDPMVRELRYLEALACSRTLLLNSVWVFSPIVHCHEMSKLLGMPHDADFWLEYDTTMLRGSVSTAVLMLPGWPQSKGVKGEVDLSIKLGRQIVYISSSGEPLVKATLSRHSDSSQPPAP